MSIVTHFRSAIGGVCLIVSTFAQSAPSDLVTTDSELRTFNVPSGKASKTLKQAASQAGVEFIFSAQVVRGVRTNSIQGEYIPADAFERMLDGTPLVASQHGDSGIFAIKRIDRMELPVPVGGGQDRGVRGKELASVLDGLMPFGSIGQRSARPRFGNFYELEAIEVAGNFGESLVASLGSRRRATQLQDTVFAEDIGKFPELNLAEALQRMPGVAIQRENGEGRRIQLRGLSTEFMRVLLNGVPLSTAQSGRAVDFDVFPSELFTRVTVDKTASASQIEGGVSGSINLRNARPFDFAGEGLTVSSSFQLGHNSLSESWDPRGHVLATQTFSEGKFGLLAGIAWSRRSLRVDASETLEWGGAGLGGVIRGYEFDPDGDGVPVNQSGLESALFDDWLRFGERRPIEVVANDPSVDLDSGPLERVRLPRLQRTDLQIGTRNRKGIVLATQFRPDSDNALFNLEYFSSDLDETQERYNLDVELRNQTDLVPINFEEVSENETLIRGTIGNADRRSESREIGFKDRFEQLSSSFQWRAGDFLVLDGSFALNRSQYGRDMQTYLFEIPDSIVTFDYSVGVIPAIESNVSLTDPRSFSATTLRVDSEGRLTDDPSGVLTPTISLVRNSIDVAEEKNLSAHLDATFGTIVRNVRVGLALDQFERTEIERDRNMQAVELFTEFSEGRVVSSEQGTRLLSDVVPAFGQILDTPENSVTDHVVADFDALDAFFTGGNRQVLESSISGFGDTPLVEESNLGLYVEANGISEFFGRQFRYNAGIRTVNTHQVSRNTNPDGSSLDADRDYWNTLPSFNLAYDANKDVVLRLSGSQTLTRPSISELQANTSIGNEFSVKSRNPYLNPFLSDQLDLAAEWYYAPRSLFAVNVFYKEVTGFLETRTTTTRFSETGLDIRELDPNIYSDLRPDTLITRKLTVNSDEVRTFRGAEIVWQTPLDFIVDGLGFYGNYSLVNSSEITLSSGGTIVTSAIQGLSENLMNLVLFYESDLFSIRGSYNWRDDFAISTGLRGTQTDLISREAAGQFDLSAAIPVPGYDDLQITIEGVNLNDASEYEYFGVPERNRRFAGTGRQLFVGVRGTF